MADINIERQNFQNPPSYQSETSKSENDGLGQALNAGLGFAARLAGTAANVYSGGALGGLTGGGGALGGLSGQLNDNNAQFMQLLQLQNQMQVQSQQFNTLSNVSKTEHETRMAAVRNIRA